jgi:putative RNA 2'-phosphotransferase
MANLKRLSKFLAVILRHRAGDFGLTLDQDGFTDLESVLIMIEKRYPGQYSAEDLLAVVQGHEHGKKRYEIRDGRIRALFGHSDVTPVTYPPVEPPEILYHGTTPEALESIRASGLKAMSSQYVHLGTSTERATRVAARHTGTPVILRIRAGNAHCAGIVFYSPESEHYLARTVPPKFIGFRDQDQ